MIVLCLEEEKEVVELKMGTTRVQERAEKRLEVCILAQEQAQMEGRVKMVTATVVER